MDTGQITDKVRFSSTSFVNLHLFSELSDCAGRTIDWVTRGNVAFSGGSTYHHLFKAWRNLHPDCSRASFYPVDERMVPFSDPESNWGTAAREFLVPVGKESDKDHFPTSIESFLTVLKNIPGENRPVFDVIFLGVGDDGHTASLFPGTPYLDDMESTVLQTKSPKPPYDRLTIAPAVISAAKEVVVILSGAGKNDILTRLLQNDENLPIVKVLSRRSESTIYIDRSLASTTA